MITIILIAVLSIVLVTVYEVVKNMRKGDVLNVNSSNSFYKLARRKPDTKILKVREGEELTSLNACSYAFWIRNDNYNDDWLVFYRGVGDKRKLEVRVKSGGALEVVVSTGSNTSRNVIKEDIIMPRTRTHIGLCLDNMEKFLEIYINGELIHTEGGLDIEIGNDPLEINPDNKEGTIQDLKYYTDILSSKQMMRLYNGQKGFVNFTNFFKKSKSDKHITPGEDKTKCEDDDRSPQDKIKDIINKNKLSKDETDTIITGIFTATPTPTAESLKLPPMIDAIKDKKEKIKEGEDEGDIGDSKVALMLQKLKERTGMK